MQKKEVKEYSCPACDGGGRIFQTITSGDLRQLREVSSCCWLCRGKGLIEINKDDREDSLKTRLYGGHSQ
jgi:DnaJ-class molecular chaperone